MRSSLFLSGDAYDQNKRKAPVHISERSYMFVRLLLISILLMSGMQIAMPVLGAETGIKGTVLWGPVEPGPSTVGQNDEAPLSASFVALDPEQNETRSESDKEGRFVIYLPAGKYTIVPDKSKPALFPGKQSKMVTVPECGFAEVTLRYDTGMR